MALKIKPESLINLFEEYKGKKFVSLETKTTPKLNKKGRVTGLTILEKFGVEPDTIFKYSKFSAGIGYDYVTLIHNRLIKDENLNKSSSISELYQAGTTWHHAYNGSTVIRQHNTKPDELYFYVSLIANNPPKSEYRSGNKVLDKDSLAEFLDIPRKPTNQGLAPERTIEVRTLKLDSVTRFIGEGCDFLVE
jgi:hypothetical protein